MQRSWVQIPYSLNFFQVLFSTTHFSSVLSCEDLLISQECVYRCIPELWLRKIFPKNVFVSTNLPDKRLQVTNNQQELDELDDDSTDIYKSNIIERYTIRPNNIPSVNMCPAEFAAYYYKDYKTDISETIDAQPEVLTDDIIEQLNVSTDNNSPFQKI